MNTSRALSLQEAVLAIQAGKVIIYPTETFYAIGCDAFNGQAVEAVYHMKQRSAYFPLPLIVPDISFVEELADNVPETARKLMERFWPGPLTLLLPARKDLPSFMVRGSDYVAVRLSSHPLAMQMAKEAGCVLTASSANISGFPPAWHPDELCNELRAVCHGVVVEQPFPKGRAPSTIVRIDFERGREKVCIRRGGAISKNDLEKEGFVVM